MIRSQIEAVTMACNIDCMLFRAGRCPYRWPEKDECPHVRHYMGGYDIASDDDCTDAD